MCVGAVVMEGSADVSEFIIVVVVVSCEPCMQQIAPGQTSAVVVWNAVQFEFMGWCIRNKSEDSGKIGNCSRVQQRVDRTV